MDVEHEAMQVRQVLDHAAGKVRMAAAKAEMSTYHTRVVSHIRSAASLPANDLQEARLTLAARNGKDQTEADLKSVAEDLAKLATFKDNSER